MNWKKVVCNVMTLLLLTAMDGKAQQVTIGNNLLYDAWLTPNLRVGVRLSPHWSAGLTAGYRPWPTDDNTSRKWRHLLVSPDVRYWTDSVNVHHFFGFNLIYSHYNVADLKFPFGLWKSVRNERRQGDLGAVGAYYGYSWPLGRHWNIEAHLGAALGYTRFTSYACGHCGTRLGRRNKLFVLPQAGLSIVYNIPGRALREAEPVREVVAEVVPPTPATDLKMEKPFVPQLTPVADFTGRAGQLQQENPVVAHVSTYKPYDRTRILRREKGALFVHFNMGKAVIEPGYRDNRQTLDRIVDITRQIMTDTTSKVAKIQIIGLASVEGKPAVNERLATKRAKALQSYVQQQVSVPDSLFDTVGGGEAWADFRDNLQELAEGNAVQAENLKKAMDIIDSESNLRQREWRIRQLDGGRTWQILHKEVLANQRNAGYVRIFFDYVPDEAAATINRGSELLNKGRYAEALTLLQTVRNDERAQNALGVALWQTGRQEEALDCFRRAAAHGNADAQENLRQLSKK